MKILLTGASGLIGSKLGHSLATEGHEVVKLRRTAGIEEPNQASWNPAAGKISLAAAEPLDAVIHLAGETIAQRWTPAGKARIRDSRVNGTRLLSKAGPQLVQPPKILISASAIGYYGNRGDEWLGEESAPGSGFLAELCREWESATEPAAGHGVRMVNLRFGIVLASRGGALKKMLPAFRLGLGGKLGSGRQFWSWISLQDVVEIIRHLLFNEKLHGPVNAVSPQPVTNAEFTRTLGAVLHRPAFFAVPEFAVKLLFGEMGETALLASCRVRPARLEENGFVFRFPKLE